MLYIYIYIELGYHKWVNVKVIDGRVRKYNRASARDLEFGFATTKDGQERIFVSARNINDQQLLNGRTYAVFLESNEHPNTNIKWRAQRGYLQEQDKDWHDEWNANNNRIRK